MPSHETIGNSSDGVACAWVGSVDWVEQRRNIRSPVALAWRVDAYCRLTVTITWSVDATGVTGRSNGPDCCNLAVAGRSDSWIRAIAGRSVEARRHRAARSG